MEEKMSEFHATLGAGEATGLQESRQAIFETPGRVRLRIQNAVGTVEIDTDDIARTEVSLVSLHPGADDLVRNSRVFEKSEGGVHEITVEIPKIRPRGGYWLGDDAGVRAQVLVPRDAEIQVATASASVGARGSYRSVGVDTASGSICVEDATGPVKVTTAGGSVQVGSVGGAVNVRTASGNVRVDHVASGGKVATASGDIEVKRVESPVRLRSISGDIRVGEALHGSSAETVSGNLRIERAAAGEIVLRSVSGDVFVAVAPGSLVRFDTVSMSGRVRSDIDLEPGRPASGERGAFEELSIQSKTVSGNISVLRAARSTDPE
jgi:DUF4097 and DUF4098 domain-containing protein YvlB